MIIKQLSGTRFGRHETFDFDCAGPVVGLIGPNGSGKSTILALLEFLITGETRDNLDSYVKDLDGNGGGRLEFDKNGKQGVITRQIGKTPKRELVWDGRKITKAKEVDATMAEIFGADKKAVANAVFVQQNELAKLLFKDGPDRRTTFIKLVNLDYCRKRADLVAGKITKLQSTIEDLEPGRVAALSNRDQAAEHLVTYNQNLEALPDWSQTLAFCQKRQKQLHDLEGAQQELARLQAGLVEAQHAVQDALSQAGMRQVEDLNTALVNVKEQQTQANQAWQQAQTVSAELQHYDRVTEEIKALNLRLHSLQAELATANPGGLDAVTVKARQRVLQDQLVQWDRADQWSLARGQAINVNVKAKAALDELQAPDKPREDLESIKQDLNDKSTLLNQLKAFKAVQAEISGCFTGKTCTGDLQCPKCGLQVAAGSALTPEGQRELFEQICRISEDAEDLRKVMTTLDQSWRTYDRELTTRKTNTRNSAKQLEQLEAAPQLPPDADRVAIQDDLDQLAGVLAVVTRVPASIEQVQRDVRQKTIEKLGYKLAAQYLNRRAEVSTERVAELRRAVLEINTEVQTWTTHSGNVDRAVGVVRNVMGQVANCEDRMVRLQSDQAEAWPQQLTDLQSSLPGQEFSALLAEAQARQTSRQMAEVRCQEARRTFETANQQYLDIEARIEKDKVKRELIKDLVKLKEIVSDSGLPMAWVGYQFEHLARLTQEGLTKLNANFRIQIDRSDDLAFSFQRLDEDNPVELPMNKLSGGQRVRLAVAFLSAVQKHLVPEVGLLVLDEPSQDLDKAGREAVAEFLVEAAQNLQNSNMQIWCCDHAPELEHAFSKKKVLV